MSVAFAPERQPGISNTRWNIQKLKRTGRITCPRISIGVTF